jgi:hypothetical protein
MYDTWRSYVVSETSVKVNDNLSGADSPKYEDVALAVPSSKKKSHGQDLR